MSYAAYSPAKVKAPVSFLSSLSLSDEPLTAHRQIVEGLRPAMVTKLAELLGLDAKTICLVAGIDRTTFARKAKVTALLSPDQSARIYWFAKVLDAATSLHEGDKAKALAWLQRPAWGLGGQKPEDLLTTATGAQAVIDLIGQIEHGIAI